MGPYQDGFPHHLPKLFKREEILIVHVYPMMKTYQLKGGMIGYKGDVFNIKQDIVGYKDFRVQRQAIQQWLTFLQANSLLYDDINIDFNLLLQLPEENSVKGQVNIMEE
eukprot:1130618-Ditylum_brightwellii.AAC.1